MLEYLPKIQVLILEIGHYIIRGNSDQNFISVKNVKSMHFHDLFTMYEDCNLMQHSQHCQENFNLLEEPACIARTFREGGKKWKQFKPFTNIFLSKNSCFWSKPLF